MGKNSAVTLFTLAIVLGLIVFEFALPLQVSGSAATTPIPISAQNPTPNPESPILFASVSKLWEHASTYSVVNSPVIMNGLIFLTSAYAPYGQMAMQCLDSSGVSRWSNPKIHANFTLSKGYLYTNDFLFLTCLYANTGTQKWRFTSGISYAAPLVDADIVYVNGFFPNPEGGIVDTGSIYAVNASTGMKLWSFAGPFGTRFNDKSLVLRGATLYTKGITYLDQDASWCSNIYALAAYSGVQLWNYTASGQFNSIVADNQNVYISSNQIDTRSHAEASHGYVYEGGICALHASNGALVWNYSTGSSVTTMNLVNGTLYAVSDDGVIYAFNGSDGRLVWSYISGIHLGSILSVDDYLYVGSSRGVYCFNAYNGDVVWNFAAPDFYGTSTTLPTYANGVVYVGWDGPVTFAPTLHNFYALAASTGDKLWNYSLTYSVKAPPTIENGIIYVGASFVTDRSSTYLGSGAIFAFRANIFFMPTPKPTQFPTLSPTPTPSSPSPSASLSPTPLPSVPEFPNWTYLAVLALMFSVVVLFRRKLKLAA